MGEVLVSDTLSCDNWACLERVQKLEWDCSKLLKRVLHIVRNSREVPTVVLKFIINCEQSLFWWKIRGKERETSERASVTASVTCSSFDVHVTCISQLPMSRLRAQDRSFFVAFFFAFFPAAFRQKERVLAV